MPVESVAKEEEEERGKEAERGERESERDGRRGVEPASVITGCKRDPKTKLK